MDFRQLVNDNKRNVKNIIKLFVKEENEDLEQEVYVKVWQKKEVYNEQGKFSSWIATVAKNVAKDYLKSKNKNFEKNISQDENAVNLVKDKKHSPELKLIINERQKRISKAILALKPRLKEVIILYEIEGLSYEMIAKKLKIPEGTVKSRLYNAKKELMIKLEDLL